MLQCGDVLATSSYLITTTCHLTPHHPLPCKFALPTTYARLRSYGNIAREAVHPSAPCTRHLWTCAPVAFRLVQRLLTKLQNHPSSASCNSWGRLCVSHSTHLITAPGLSSSICLFTCATHTVIRYTTLGQRSCCVVYGSYS